jgi:hypothetical protein
VSNSDACIHDVILIVRVYIDGASKIQTLDWNNQKLEVSLKIVRVAFISRGTDLAWDKGFYDRA